MLLGRWGKLGRVITWLSWRHRFLKAPSSKCFPSTPKHKASLHRRAGTLELGGGGGGGGGGSEKITQCPKVWVLFKRAQTAVKTKFLMKPVSFQKYLFWNLAYSICIAWSTAWHKGMKETVNSSSYEKLKKKYDGSFRVIQNGSFKSHHKKKSLDLRLPWLFCLCFVDGNMNGFSQVAWQLFGYFWLCSFRATFCMINSF